MSIEGAMKHYSLDELETAIRSIRALAKSRWAEATTVTLEIEERGIMLRSFTVGGEIGALITPTAQPDPDEHRTHSSVSAIND
jgi:hypothetical protein